MNIRHPWIPWFINISKWHCHCGNPSCWVKIDSETVDGQKIKPHRHLPSKTPHPKFQCCTKLYLTSSAFRVWFFVHRTQPRSLKTTLKFGGAGVDNNTARVWFHRPSTVVIIVGCASKNVDMAINFHLPAHFSCTETLAATTRGATGALKWSHALWPWWKSCCF